MIKEADLYQRTVFFEKVFSKSKMKMVFRIKPALWSSQDYFKRIELLKSLGFVNPEKMINLSPTLLSYSDDQILSIVEFVKQIGFHNPVYLLERLPTLFGMSKEAIKIKVENLKSIGVQNYVKFIMSFPAVLNLSVFNLQQKFNYLRRCYALFDKNIDVASAIESRPALLAYSYSRLHLVFRFCVYNDFYPKVSLLSNILSDPASKIRQYDLQKCNKLRLAYFAYYNKSNCH